MSEYNRHKWAMEWMHGGGRDPNGRSLDDEIRIGKEDWLKSQQVAERPKWMEEPLEPAPWDKPEPPWWEEPKEPYPWNAKEGGPAQLVQPGPERQGYADDHLDKANLVRKQDAIKNLNEKWTAEKVKEAAEKIYPDEELDAILNDIVKRRQINKHLTEYGEGLVESEARIEGRKQRTITLRDRDITDIRKNLVKNNKKVTMVNGKFIFADAKLQEAFVDEMILKYKHPATGRRKMEAGVLSNKQIFKKYFEGTYSEKGVHDLINRFKTELGLEFKKLPPGERNVDQLRRQAKLLISQAGTRISGLRPSLLTIYTQ